jgi:transcriptional regulator with XRE-family HTH domain
MDIAERFGRNVRSLREAAGISQDEFADMAGIHRTYISGIERGKRAPTIIVVEKIAVALGVDPGVLFRPCPSALAPDDQQGRPASAPLETDKR